MSNLSISFGPSRSDGFPAAVEIARTLPGYESDGQRHHVSLLDESVFLAVPLLHRVAGWASTVVKVNSRILSRVEALHLSRTILHQMSRCYRIRGDECRLMGPPQELCPLRIEPNWNRETCLARILAQFGDLCPAQDPGEWADLLVLRAGGHVSDSEIGCS